MTTFAGLMTLTDAVMSRMMQRLWCEKTLQQFWNDGTHALMHILACVTGHHASTNLSHTFAHDQQVGFLFLDLTGEHLSFCLAANKHTEDNVLCGEGASLDGRSSMETLHAICDGCIAADRSGSHCNDQ
jgi:tryptophan synthase beta subunit